MSHLIAMIQDYGLAFVFVNVLAVQVAPSPPSRDRHSTTSSSHPRSIDRMIG